MAFASEEEGGGCLLSGGPAMFWAWNLHENGFLARLLGTDRSCEAGSGSYIHSRALPPLSPLAACNSSNPDLKHATHSSSLPSPEDVNSEMVFVLGCDQERSEQVKN